MVHEHDLYKFKKKCIGDNKCFLDIWLANHQAVKNLWGCKHVIWIWDVKEFINIHVKVIMGEIPACLEYLDLAMDKILELRWAMSFDQGSCWKRPFFPLQIVKRLFFFLQGVHLEESTSPISKQISTDLSDFVRNLTNPKQDSSEHTHDFAEKLANPGNKMRLKSADLSSQLKEKCAISEKQDVRDIKQNWRQRMMERRINRTKAQDCTSPMDSFGSTDCEKSFDSVSSSSGNKPSFQCDSSTETSESELLATPVSTHSEQKATKKEKDSKKRRFRRMITRPLRRSQSAGWEKDIPTHFMEKSTDDEDTVSTFRRVQFCLGTQWGLSFFTYLVRDVTSFGSH